MFPEDVIRTIVGESDKTAYRICRDLNRALSYISNTRDRKEVQLATIADIADVCGMDVVIIDRKTKKRICKVDAPRNRK